MTQENDNLTTIYTPTEAEQKILETLQSSESFNSITALCEKAGVVRDVWYDALKKQDFVAKLVENSKTLLYASFPSVITSVVKMAQRGSFAHQKMILEMLKVYQGSPLIDARTQNNIQVQLTPEQAEEKMIAYLERKGYEVKRKD